MLYMSLWKIQSDMELQLLHFTSGGAYVAMEISHVRITLPLIQSLSRSLYLAGVNGASFCLVQHPCYFDVLAIPLPDQ